MSVKLYVIMYSYIASVNAQILYTSLYTLTVPRGWENHKWVLKQGSADQNLLSWKSQAKWISLVPVVDDMLWETTGFFFTLSICYCVIINIYCVHWTRHIMYIMYDLLKHMKLKLKNCVENYLRLWPSKQWFSTATVKHLFLMKYSR